MINQSSRSRGGLTISLKVISKIAGMAVQEAEAVKALASGKTKRRNKEDFYKAIEITNNEGVLAVHLFPVVALGTPLRQLAELLQRSVKYKIEQLTGLQVAVVHVTVVGMDMEQ